MSNLSQFFCAAFKRIPIREPLYFLMFVALSLGFWLIITLQESFEYKAIIKLRPTNVPLSTAIIDAPEEIEITLKDQGAVLINYMWNNTFAPIEIDLSHFSEQRITLNRSTIEEILSHRLNATTSVSEISPDTIIIQTEHLIEKQIPTHFAGEISPALGYIIKRAPTIEPSRATVNAPVEVMDRLDILQTESFTATDVKHSIKRTIALCEHEGAIITPQEVTLECEIEEAAEKSFTLDIIPINVPDGMTIRLLPSQIGIKCTLPISLYHETVREDFRVVVDYLELQKDQSGYAVPRISHCPNILHEATLSTQRIDYIIEQ